MYLLILAGGAGTRLWPLSRQSKPKQISEFLSASGGETMIERTWRRSRKQYPAKNIFVCTDKNSAKFIKEKLSDLPRANLIVEPMSRGTAAAIGYGAAHILAKYGDVPVIVLSSDAHIGDEKKYLQAFSRIEKMLKRFPDHTVLLGIKPEYAETGYGYIEVAKATSKFPISNFQFPILEVKKFIEKPALKQARRFIKNGRYFWNPGIFGWKIKHLIELYANYLPRTHKALIKMFNYFNPNPRAFPRERRMGPQSSFYEYKKMDATSVDYGIVEKEKNLLVIPADFGWADLGHWRTVHEILSGHPDDNIVRGKHISIDSSGNLIYSTSGRLIATAGLKNMIIIETDDAILICPRDRSQDVKKLTELLKKKGLAKYL